MFVLLQLTIYENPYLAELLMHIAITICLIYILYRLSIQIWSEPVRAKNTAKTLVCFFNNFGVSCMMMDYWALLFLLLVEVDDPPGLEPNPF